MNRVISPRKVVITAVALLAALGGFSPTLDTPLTKSMLNAAWADEAGGQTTGKGNQGGQGHGSKGSQAGQETSSDHGSGQGGPGPDSDGKGPQKGGPAGSTGEKPVWSHDAFVDLGEVELGRLNVARSPDHVLDRAFDEAVATFTAEMIDELYNQTFDDIVKDFKTKWDKITIIDSPLQNLALLQALLSEQLNVSVYVLDDEGNPVLNDDGTPKTTTLAATEPEDVLKLAAVFLGTASDKTVPISAGTVIEVTTILGTPVPEEDIDTIAAEAEAIRQAILAGHG